MEASAVKHQTISKEYLKALADYNIWTDNIIMEWLDQIDDRQWEQPVVSSFSSIKQTVLHMVSAKKIWIDFWTNVPDPAYLSAGFKGTKNELIGIWKKASVDLKNFMETFPEENYQQPITFKYPKGGEGRMAFWQTFPHFINHATYHRGQLVTMLRQAGFTGFTSTDLATYFISRDIKSNS